MRGYVSVFLLCFYCFIVCDCVFLFLFVLIIFYYDVVCVSVSKLMKIRDMDVLYNSYLGCV